MMVPKSKIHKQKRKFFALVSISLCLLLPPPTFHKIMLRSSKAVARDAVEAQGGAAASSLTGRSSKVTLG